MPNLNKTADHDDDATMRKRPPPLNLQQDTLDEPSPQNDENDYHMGSTTYRQEGVSIGPDYLRLEGRTVTRGTLVPSSLRVVGPPLGQGACSVVLKAEWTSEKKITLVALKQFPLHASRERRDMLWKEIKTLGCVECSCLMELLGAFLDQDAVTLVLEYFDCGSLQDFLQTSFTSGRFPLSEQVLAAMGYQIAWGLAYLHHENMLHRDVKPENVLLRSDGSVKLSDFGLASIRNEFSMNTTMVGTARYMAPERLEAKPYGVASDVWSMGLVLLETATGRRPWHEANSMVELILTIEETVSTPDWLPHTIPGGQRELVEACLQQTPAKRMPAEVLLKSPWFKSNGVCSVEEAVQVMRIYHDTVSTRCAS